MITGIAHVNMLVPPGTLSQATAFYGKTLGFTPVPAPVQQQDSLAWCVLPFSHMQSKLPLTTKSRFDITPNGQQVHIAFGTNELASTRHPCFKVGSPEALLELRKRVWEHFERKDEASPREADKPGEVDSGMLSF